jgi:hypothetical protein
MFIHDIKLTLNEYDHATKQNDNPLYTDVEVFMQEELDSIRLEPAKSFIEGRWVYINGRIPRTADNIHITNLSQINERNARNNALIDKFRVINDKPLRLFGHEEEDLYKKIVTDL